MLRKVHLHGALGDRFGSQFRLDVSTAPEAVRALSVQLQGFREFVADHSFRVVRGDLAIGFELGEDDLSFRLGRADLHIVPVLAGSGRNGVGKIILGAVIIAAAFYFAPAVVGALGPTQGLGTAAFTVAGSAVTYGNIAMVGAAIALGGISQALSPQPKVGDYSGRESPDERPSFLFNGAVNTSEQGGPVPLIYGRFRVGSQVVSAGLEVEQI